VPKTSRSASQISPWVRRPYGFEDRSTSSHCGGSFANARERCATAARRAPRARAASARSGGARRRHRARRVRCCASRGDGSWFTPTACAAALEVAVAVVLLRASGAEVAGFDGAQRAALGVDLSDLGEYGVLDLARHHLEVVGAAERVDHVRHARSCATMFCTAAPTAIAPRSAARAPVVERRRHRLGPPPSAQASIWHAESRDVVEPAAGGQRHRAGRKHQAQAQDSGFVARRLAHQPSPRSAVGAQLRTASKNPCPTPVIEGKVRRPPRWRSRSRAPALRRVLHRDREAERALHGIARAARVRATTGSAPSAGDCGSVLDHVVACAVLRRR